MTTKRKEGGNGGIERRKKDEVDIRSDTETVSSGKESDPEKKDVSYEKGAYTRPYRRSMVSC